MKIKILFLFFLLFNTTVVFSQYAFKMEMHGGFPINIASPVHIVQSGHDPIRFNAHFYSEPFYSPQYWMWRLGIENDKGSYELEAIHHKLYLSRENNIVKQFSISHGLNIITINKGIVCKNFLIHLGVGPILAHPENNVRDKALDQTKGLFGMGYYITGPCTNIAISRKIFLTKKFYSNFELKHTFAYANVPVVDGYAEVYNNAFHLIFGLGFINKK